MKLPVSFTKTSRLAAGGGFTLVELLVVIAIIAVLAIAVLATINPLEVLRKSRDAERLATAQQVVNGVEAYNANVGCYPWQRGTAVAPAACDTLGYPDTTGALLAAAAFNTGTVQGRGRLARTIMENIVKTNITSKTSIVQSSLTVNPGGTGGIILAFEPESRAGWESLVYGQTYTTATCATTTVCTQSGFGSATDCWVCIQ